ncbi:MAG: aminopeptidase [Thermoplasmata archaeon]|jgi:leucyl aminopeptidase (aminopeptidase T)|nr:aminopeptidase [Thermoplasmata archaeon]
MPKAPPPTDPQSKLAQSILRNNLQLKPGENVTIEAWPHTLPWAVVLAREARRMKAFPVIHYEDENAYWDTVESGGAKLLGQKPAHEWASLAKTDVYIHMWGPGDRVRLNAMPAKESNQLFEWNDSWYDTAKKAGLRGARLELGRPYPNLAKAYGVDLDRWTQDLVEGTMVDPMSLAKTAAPIAKALKSGKRIHITHENGTDLTLGLAGRDPVANTGRLSAADLKLPFRMLTSLPSGSVRVALDESVADGVIVGNRTDYYDDRVATEPRFEFVNGRLVSATFGSGGDKFQADFKKGGKGRDQPGQLAIGLNPKLHNTPQVEDMEAGAIMVSVGANRNLGGKNKANLFAWAIVAGADFEVDGKRIPLPH